MKILVIDREDLTAQLMTSRLEALGHQIIHEPSKNDAVERAKEEHFDLIFIDPAPLTSAQSVIVKFRRATPKYQYIVQLGTEVTLKDAVDAGANDALSKPIDPEQLDQKITNAKNLLALIKRISDQTEDFPSAGGIIAKSAFNQLFLSAIERADRYAEQSFIVFIGLSNYAAISDSEGISAANYAAAQLSQHLTRLRRQSDIIAQTDGGEFALLLQRPLYETEPTDATNRFAETITGFKDIFSKDGIAPELYVRLVELPTGACDLEHVITKDHVSG